MLNLHLGGAITVHRSQRTALGALAIIAPQRLPFAEWRNTKLVAQNLYSNWGHVKHRRYIGSLNNIRRSGPRGFLAASWSAPI